MTDNTYLRIDNNVLHLQGNIYTLEEAHHQKSVCIQKEVDETLKKAGVGE